MAKIVQILTRPATYRQDVADAQVRDLDDSAKIKYNIPTRTKG